jgi:hypothetical protein
MGTAQLVFAVERCGGATGSGVTGNDVTGSDVSHMTGSDHVREYILRIRNRKLYNIRPSRAFWPEVTKSRDWKRPCPEVALIGSMFCACPAFSRAFFLSSCNMATGCVLRSLDPNRGSLWCAQHL